MRFFLIVLFPLSLLAQTGPSNATIDSLKGLLEQEDGLTERKVDLLNQLGFEHWIIHPARSIGFGTEALEIARVLPYPPGEAFANRVIGVAHWAQGNLELSFRYLLDARRQYARLNDSLGVANSNLNLGMAYADQGNYDLANRNYEDALRVFRSRGALSRVATTYTKVADLLLLQEKFAAASEFLHKALDIHRQQNFVYGIGEAHQKLGQLAAARGDDDQAISHYLLAVKSSGQRDNHVGLAENYLGIGKAYLRKGEEVLAASYLDRARRLAEGFGLQRVRRDVYFSLMELEKDRGNFAAALTNAEAFLAVKDSLFNKEKSNLIANMEARRAYLAQREELALAQKNLDLAEARGKVTRLTRWLLFLGLLVVIVVAYLLLASKDQVIDRKRAALRKAHRRTDDLKSVLRTKEQELTSYTLNFVQKNEGLAELQTLIEQLKRKVGKEHRPTVQQLERKLEGLLRIDEDWNDFRKHFESVHPELINRLAQEYPKLTNSDFRLIALVRLNLSSKEISSVLGISPDSVKTARYRLRKKLGLESQDKLFDFLVQRG